MTPHTEIFNDLLKLAVDSGVSDVVIKTNKPGYVRLAGKLKPVDMDPITGEEAKAWVDEHVPRVFKPLWEENNQVDFAYATEGIGRFRVNAFYQRGTVSVVLRHIKSKVPEFDELGLNGEPLLNLAKSKDGILLICGATGSGKSSTMAAMLNWINRNLDRHIVTIEDPIEYTFVDDKSVFQQREIGTDVPNFDLAIKAVLRQNPDIILIGEMRDRETFETAISAAETGHLVFSTMHAATVAQSLTRLFEFFPPEQLAQARRQIAGSLRGFICQKLIPTIEGEGRVPATEVMAADQTVKNLILEGENEKIQGLLNGGTDSASHSFNRDIMRLIKEGKISKADGVRYSPNPQALEMNLKGIFFK
ncbi:type IV pilus twitching motility protein PilT [Synoicihabitans lomoniglobus]|uniref:PilT/PilU family type 4a pilus ATPase n=1 Tax=Synoicihabitans lomoniglobus TaxID=2909285 RepID=A0AAF0CRS7_9BACT|nr:PilT/PilU family type 4a pilus ATPase [Opitutaceae bacterium LMO-M01]WED66866.1 PilT/PilU family type 4a pilus ATPase [Opitutaceae bacterium LMO-M01]